MKKILVIDNNKDILENTAEVLELSNYKVITAEGGREGVEKAMTTAPDLIICDVMMPGLDGYGVLHMVQRSPELQQTPFIFLTAKTDAGDVRKGMAMGADDYITKPFNPTDLLDAVETRLKKADMMKRKLSPGIDGMKELINITGGEKALKDFVEGRHTDFYRRKQKIFSERNHQVRLYYLEKGKVKIYRINNSGKELIVRIVNPGEFFGYIPMLEGTKYKDNAEALQDSQVAAIPKAEFDELLFAHPEVSRKFIRLLANEVSEREQQLLNIAYSSLRKKVANALLVLHEKYAQQPEEYIHLTRENLAAIAGTATESLIRTLTEFKEEGKIDIRDGKIKILEPEKLQSMLN